MRRYASDDEPAPHAEELHRLAEELVALGEGRTAVDLLRRAVDAARTTSGTSPVSLLRLLSQYASVLESTEAFAEADFIRTEALEIVAAERLETLDAFDAYLRHGMLLVKMHNYDGAVARLKEAIARAEGLENVGELHRQIMLAHAWRSRSQALEALGEFSEASAALDVLMNVKRQIRLLVFSVRRAPKR